MLHDSSVGKVDVFLGLTVGMNTANSIFVFGTISYPLGCTFSNRFMVIIILFTTPRSPTLFTYAYLFFLIVINRYYFGSRILCKFITVGRTITTVAIKNGNEKLKIIR